MTERIEVSFEVNTFGGLWGFQSLTARTGEWDSMLPSPNYFGLLSVDSVNRRNGGTKQGSYP